MPVPAHFLLRQEDTKAAVDLLVKVDCAVVGGHGGCLDEALNGVAAEGYAVPQRVVTNQYGRPEPNPARARLDAAIRYAEDRIRTAKKPVRLARKVILDELREEA